ncbi:hypothetical protein [Luteolibacter sp. LG18]|uniref:hypothetical protein n=1 Tax=Luteolibacter sp. LG18 TaxID=2819286 RepID=UPI0030C7586A
MKPGRHKLTLVTGLTVLLTLPWWLQAVRAIRLEWLARSLTATEEAALLASKQMDFDSGAPAPVISLAGSFPRQRGIIRFRDGGHVRFAFSSHPGVAVFVGGNYHRIVSSNGWCCEVQLPVVENLAHLDQMLDRMQEPLE